MAGKIYSYKSSDYYMPVLHTQQPLVPVFNYCGKPQIQSAASMVMKSKSYPRTYCYLDRRQEERGRENENKHLLQITSKYYRGIRFETYI
jgi:hypothetical protein